MLISVSDEPVRKKPRIMLPARRVPLPLEKQALSTVPKTTSPPPPTPPPPPPPPSPPMIKMKIARNRNDNSINFAAASKMLKAKGFKETCRSCRSHGKTSDLWAGCEYRKYFDSVLEQELKI